MIIRLKLNNIVERIFKNYSKCRIALLLGIKCTLQMTIYNKVQ